MKGQNLEYDSTNTEEWDKGVTSQGWKSTLLEQRTGGQNRVDQTSWLHRSGHTPPLACMPMVNVPIKRHVYHSGTRIISALCSLTLFPRV